MTTEPSDSPLDPESPSPEVLEKLKKAKKMKKLGSNRGIETLFRNIYRVHVEVSAMADNKANFLISVNSIILILAAAHGKEVVTDEILLLPAALIIGSCIGSMVYAVLVARPRVTSDHSDARDQPDGKSETNFLFFGGFTKMQRDEYVEGMTDLVTNPESIYPSMMADIYDMGSVLNRKFRRLQTAYGFLLFGLPGGIFLFLTIQTILRMKENGVL
ncbi:MAG: Pycsar system effector family protein [Verrucomicrobiota bacterium]